MLALSNPTSCCEALPELVMEVSAGRALMATGSPFPPVGLPDGRSVAISQCNNLYVIPGMGLGACVCQAQTITPQLFQAAVRAISELVTPEERAEGRLLPPLQDARRIARAVALAVARQAREDGIGLVAGDEQLGALLDQAMWTPRYYPYRFRTQ